MLTSAHCTRRHFFCPSSLKTLEKKIDKTSQLRKESSVPGARLYQEKTLAASAEVLEEAGTNGTIDSEQYSRRSSSCRSRSCPQPSWFSSLPRATRVTSTPFTCRRLSLPVSGPILSSLAPPTSERTVASHRVFSRHLLRATGDTAKRLVSTSSDL